MFTPSASFEVGKGWEVSADETKDSLAITREEHKYYPEISFVNVDEVFHAENPIDPDDPIVAENAMPAPDDLVGWLKTHPHLEVVSEKKVTVGGASGVQLDALISSAPENHPAECQGPCVAIFANSAATYYYPGSSYRFIILNLGMETVAIVINSLATDHLQLAEKVLDTVVWSNRQLLPEEEISSEWFKPTLSFASGGFWMVLYETTDTWQLQQRDSHWNFSFVKVDKIRDPQDPTDEDKAMPIPNDDLVAWLKGHPQRGRHGRAESESRGCHWDTTRRFGPFHAKELPCRLRG